MRLLLAGSSGFLGTALRDRLAREGHHVLRLVRGAASTSTEHSWDPAAGRVDADLVGSVDVVVNLGGAPLVRWPWTASYKRAIRDSRLATTRTLADAVARTGGGTALLNGSGIDAYGEAGDSVCDESTGFGDTFLAGVVREWEHATRPAADAGARVVLLRTGAVLHASGGALRLMQLPFRLGLGGRTGPGTQWFPVVSLEDWVRAVLFLAGSELSGPFNVVGPEPATNAEFSRTFGSVLHRPTPLPVPGRPIRLAAGDLADQVLGSRRAVPRRLLEAGFTFTHPDVSSMLTAAVQGR